MELFFAGNINNGIITLDQEESRHAVKALRLKNGDSIHLTDGNGKLFKAIITDASHREVQAEIREIMEFASRPYRIHIAIAPTKNIDRIEWFLEKATELGIDEITPISCRYSERTVIKNERLEKIMAGAMKQSNQFHLPKLNELITFSKFIEKATADEKYIAHCYENEKSPLWRSASAEKNILVLIGPEGDFSKEEVEAALTKGFKPVSLGNTRLRTETAGLAAVQTLHFVNELINLQSQ